METSAFQRKGKGGQKYAFSLSLAQYWETLLASWEWTLLSGLPLRLGCVGVTQILLSSSKGDNPSKGLWWSLERKIFFSWADDKWHFSEIRTRGFLSLPTQGVKVPGDFPSFHTLPLFNLRTKWGPGGSNFFFCFLYYHQSRSKCLVHSTMLTKYLGCVPGISYVHSK